MLKRSFVLGALFLTAFPVNFLCADPEKWDPLWDKAMDITRTNPHVIGFEINLIENGGRPHLHIENDEDEQKKGKYDVYEGADVGEMTQRDGGYSFDFNTKTLGCWATTDSTEYTPTEYNKLVFARIEVDSSFPGYSSKPLTDCNFYPKKGPKAVDRAWASADNVQGHWIQATFDAPVTLQKVMLFWAYDKGAFYQSQKIRLFYRDAWGQEREITDTRHTNDVIEKRDKVKDSDLQQTQWTFTPVVTKELIIKQEPGGGSPKRPNLMWISQVWAY